MPNPTPRVTIYIQQPGSTSATGWLVPCNSVADAQGRDCLPHRPFNLLGDLTINWGRDDVWTQPDPAVATVTIWQSDAAALEWPERNLFTATPNYGLVSQAFFVAAYMAADTAVTYIFRGRTTNVDAKRLDVRTERGIESGWAFRIQASDRLGALAQVDKQGFTKLDAGRTMKANADFLNAFASWVENRELYFEAAYQEGKCRYVDMADKNLYDVITEMYASFSHQFTYNPLRNVINRIPAAYNHGSYSLKMGRPAVGGTVRLYAPQWVDNTGREDPQDSNPYASAYIGGADVAGDVRLSSDQGQAISHIECKWFNAPGNADHISRMLVTSSANRALLRFDSWFNDGLQIDPIMAAVKRKCLAEGARPFHPTITWDTAKTGDVPDWNTFRALTLPAQTVAMAVVTGSPFAAMMNVAPVWYPAGGVIGYSAGRWRFTVNLAPAPMTLSGTAVTFANLSANTTGKTLTMGQLDESISSHDMKYVTDPALYIWE